MQHPGLATQKVRARESPSGNVLGGGHVPGQAAPTGGRRFVCELHVYA